ncbi:MAG: cytochrome b561 domain-containing protein [Ostreibacterium sp.]
MMLHWLLTPIDSNRIHQVDFLLSWHARLMVLAWVFMIPTAIIITRYFKVTPKQKWPDQLDNKFWWHSHLILQISAMLFALLGLLLILIHHGSGQNLHRMLAWFVLVLMSIQGLSGLLRGSKGGPTEQQSAGDHYDMTKHRYLFEHIHKNVGYLALVLSVIVVISGLWQANAPHWMWLTIIIWWLLLLLLVLYLQRHKGALDTYQAVWGPKSKHPGNHKPTVGWGLKRYPTDTP